MQINFERTDFFSLDSEIFGGGDVVFIFSVSSLGILSVPSYTNAITIYIYAYTENTVGKYIN